MFCALPPIGRRTRAGTGDAYHRPVRKEIAVAKYRVVVLGAEENDPLEYERAELRDIDCELVAENPQSEGEAMEGEARVLPAGADGERDAGD